MRTIESLMFAIIFLAFNVYLIGRVGTMGFGLMAQFMIAWVTTGVLLCGLYIWNEERKREKGNVKPSSN